MSGVKLKWYNVFFFSAAWFKFYTFIISSCVFLSTVCTPFGLSRMFSVTGSLLVKPRVRRPAIVVNVRLMCVVSQLSVTSSLNCSVFCSSWRTWRRRWTAPRLKRTHSPGNSTVCWCLEWHGRHFSCEFKSDWWTFCVLCCCGCR